MALKWYQTKEGRAEFGRRARERDEALRQQMLNDPLVWVGIEDDNDPTMTEAIGNILMACPQWVETAKAYAESEQEQHWRGVDFDHLKSKAKESQIEAEMVDKEYRAVIAAAKRIIQRPYCQTSLTMAV